MMITPIQNHLLQRLLKILASIFPVFTKNISENIVESRINLNFQAFKGKYNSIISKKS